MGSVSDSINVAIVEDNKALREGVTYLLRGTKGYMCVGSYGSGEEAIRELSRRKVDVVLMDIELPGMDGITCLARLKKAHHDVVVIMWTVSDEGETVFRALTAGALGYLLKSARPSEIIECIAEAHRGGSPMSGEIARKVVRSFQASETDGQENENLSDREAEILSWLSRGYKYSEIGDQLQISVETVRSHIRRVYKKLQVTSRTEAVLRYLKK
jgi:DNA-binding NarL/FixJ family response regulator